MKQKNWIILLIVTLLSSHPLQAQIGEEPEYFSVPFIQSLMTKVSNWQLENLLYESSNGYDNIQVIRKDGWIRAVLYLGIYASYQTTGNKKYLQECIDFAENNHWKLGGIPRNADNQAVAQLYLELYGIRREERMIEDIRAQLDDMFQNPSRGSDVGWSKQNWSWSDALFMAPPVMAKLYRYTNDTKYLDLLDMYYWESVDRLFDKEDHLFYRDNRYFYTKGGKAQTQSGKKVFWSRGNAWVIGGLVRILNDLPENHKNYDRYMTLYKQMARRLLELQQIDGLWRSSLLDPWQFPEKETSGSSFICYAFATGLNNGWLDEESYKIPTMRAWQALTECVQPDGKLGWVQPVGHDPQHVKSSDTMEYGVGAFLLAAREIYKMSFLDKVGKRYREDSIY